MGLVFYLHHVFLLLFVLVRRTNETVYSTDKCPIVSISINERSVIRKSFCCGYSPTNLTDCSKSDLLFWSVNEQSLDNFTIYDVIETENTTSQIPENRTDKHKRAKFAYLYPIDSWMSDGWYNEEYDKVINYFWMEFPPPPRKAHYIFAIIYTILSVISIFGNALAFVMIVSIKEFRTPSNYLVANLAVADFFMMARGPIFIFNSLHFGPVTGFIGCQIYGVIGGMTGVGAIMSLAAIARDRYCAIVHPFNPDFLLTKTKALVQITLIWSYAAIFSTAPLAGSTLGIKPYVPEGYLTSCSFDYVSEVAANRLFILFFFSAAWLVPFTIITSSYYKICNHVMTVSLARIGQERDQRKREVKLAVVVITVILIWFLSWTPYATVALIGISGNRHLLTPFWTMVPAVFCKLGATIDPFMYALNHPRFRKKLVNMWCPKTQVNNGQVRRSFT